MIDCGRMIDVKLKSVYLMSDRIRRIPSPILRVELVEGAAKIANQYYPPIEEDSCFVQYSPFEACRIDTYEQLLKVALFSSKLTI